MNAPDFQHRNPFFTRRSRRSNEPRVRCFSVPHETDPATSPYKGRRGLRRIWNACSYSLEGFAAAFTHEAAFRQEVLLAAVLVPIALAVPAGGAGKALMIGSVLMVLVVELLNSAVEAVTDRVSLENHLLAKRAKDLGSAAVMVALLNVPVVWLLVLFA
jgi:diacylglycerol kinase (ATP)